MPNLLSADWIVTTLIVIVVVTLPMKLAAMFVGAKRTDLLSCGIAVIVGVMSWAIAANLFGGYIGGALAGFVGYTLAIRFVLGTGFFAAILLTFVAGLISFAVIQVLMQIGLMAASAYAI